MSEKPPKEPGKEGEVIYVHRGETMNSENLPPQIEEILQKFRMATLKAEVFPRRGEIAEELIPIVITEMKSGRMKFSELERVVSSLLDKDSEKRVWKGIVRSLLPDQDDPIKGKAAKIINLPIKKS